MKSFVKKNMVGRLSALTVTAWDETGTVVFIAAPDIESYFKLELNINSVLDHSEVVSGKVMYKDLEQRIDRNQRYNRLM